MPEPNKEIARISGEFAGKFGGALLEKTPGRAWTEVSADKIHAALAYLKDAGLSHLSTITAVDTGKEIEVLYHLCGLDCVLTVRTRLPREDPHLQTVTGILPSAILYERELHDLFGIMVDGHPDLRILVLPEGWPEDEHPLRKDWTAPEGGNAHG